MRAAGRTESRAVPCHVLSPAGYQKNRISRGNERKKLLSAAILTAAGLSKLSRSRADIHCTPHSEKRKRHTQPPAEALHCVRAELGARNVDPFMVVPCVNSVSTPDPLNVC